MITIDDKLELFNKVVLNRAKSALEEEKVKIEKEHQVEIERYKKEIMIKGSRYSENKIKEGKTRRKKMISDAKRSSKKKLLNLEQDLIDEVMVEVKKRVKEFVQSDAHCQYIEFLLNEYSQSIMELEDFNIFLTYNHFAQCKSCIENFFENKIDRTCYEIVESKKDFIGGMIVINQKESIKINLSLESLVDQNQQLIGQKVHELLIENGENYEKQF